jgi:hypothetical protein
VLPRYPDLNKFKIEADSSLFPRKTTRQQADLVPPALLSSSLYVHIPLYLAYSLWNQCLESYLEKGEFLVQLFNSR